MCSILAPVFYVFGWVIYMIFADAEIMPWAEAQQDMDKETETNAKFSKSSGEIWNTGENVDIKHYAEIGNWNKASELHDSLDTANKL